MREIAGLFVKHEPPEPERGMLATRRLGALLDPAALLAMGSF